VNIKQNQKSFSKQSKSPKKINLNTLRRLKKRGKKTVFITAYDYPMARLAELAGVDMILIGDSVANTTLGYNSTISVGMDEMIHHSKAVTRASRRAFVIGDMPYMSYQPSDEIAIRNAGRFIAEAECDAVKCEGGKRVASRVKAMVDAGIVVMGHIGLTPQNIGQLGGYRVQGRDNDGIEVLKSDIIALEEAGCHMVLLEAMPPTAGKILTEAVEMPVYGIGAGPFVDGQLLILHDIIGLQDPNILRKPSFVKRYSDVSSIILDSIKRYSDEVRSGVFPSEEYCYKGEYQKELN
jgi:3-methyl-2-oxobutanoate hydroxymethyltransferase